MTVYIKLSEISAIISKEFYPEWDNAKEYYNTTIYFKSGLSLNLVLNEDDYVDLTEDVDRGYTISVTNHQESSGNVYSL